MKQLSIVGVFLFTFLVASYTAATDSANSLIDVSGVQGGLVVHLGGVEDGLAGALDMGDRHLVQSLDTDPTRVIQAREHLQSQGKYGRISVTLWEGKRLPYADGVVNLIIDSGERHGTLQAEIARVLAPRGVLLARNGEQGGWKKSFTKLVPETIDDWTHYRHDPTNNNIAQDSEVGPPRSIRWVAEPEMLRHHDHLPSLSAMVSGKGRVFYIFDEGPTSSIMLPPQWRLIARDAFSGVPLWKRTIDKWHPHLWPLKSMPATLPRRLVSVDDSVFVTLGIDAPVSQLNAADGSQVKVFEGSDRCEEILVKNDTLLALCLTGKGPLGDMQDEQWEYLDGRVTKFPYAARLASGIMSPLWLHADRRLVAYDVQSGGERWRYDGRFAPLSLATDGHRIFFHDGKSIVALDSDTGAQVWKSEEVPIWQEYFAWYGASLVIHDDVVLFSGGENMTWYKGGTPKGATDTMTAFSAVDGRRLWSAPHPPSGYRSPEDLMVAQGLVWAADCTHRGSSVLQGLDLHTGDVVREIETDYTHGFHHRCHPGKATENFLLLSKVGINLIDFAGKGIDNNHWVRGACGYGFMPANGMIYATPDPCNCYPESKLNGFVALATDADRTDAESSDPLVAGPAYAAIQDGILTDIDSDAWPTYRHDASRSGSTMELVSPDPKPVWKTEVGAKISAPVIVGGRVYVTSMEDHRVVALDSESGEVTWTQTVGGRVDSPPTIVRVQQGGETTDLCIFGCADGSVYCVRGADGQLVWRRRIAPTAEQIVSRGSVESVWPVHGSVLHHNGLVYAVAGRSTFVDGGLYMVGLDPVTGAVQIHRNRKLSDQNIKGMNTEPAKPDVLAASGDHLFMRSMGLDLQFEPSVPPGRHVFASNGYLNDSWFHRAFWVYGTSFAGGCGGFGKTGQANPSGRIMVADMEQVYGFGRTKYGWGSAFEYKLYATRATSSLTETPAGRKAARRRGSAKLDKSPVWSVDSPILVRSMVKAGAEVLIAGPKRLYNEAEVIQQIDQPEAQREILTQDQAWDGDGELHGFSGLDGQHLRNLTLTSMPVWDGMAVAGGSLYISSEDGTLRCLK